MKRFAVALGVLTVLVFAAPAGAELCEKCKDGMYIMSVGKCVECGGLTTSGAHKLCPKCSAKLGQCEHCRAPLKGAKPAPAYLRALELDASSNGKTISAIVGQKIIIRLKSNPTTGYSWLVGKVEGDALRQVGKVKYEQRKHAPGRVGVGGKEAFTFRTTKVGTAKLMLEYKGPGRKIARTFTLTVDIKADPTAERVRKLKANLDKFAMTICYLSRGNLPFKGGRPPRWCRHITLSVPPALVPKTPSWQVRRISKEQAGKIIDQLAKTGFLARAAPRAAPVKKMGDRYALAVYMRKPGPRSPMLMDIIENIGWGPQLLKRLEGLGLKKVLDGDAAKAVDFLLEPIREKFGKEAEKPSPAKPAKIDTKKSGKYTSGKWKYQYTISAVGTRSERRFSWLTYDGNQVAGAKMFDRIKTPWGMMQYYQMTYVRGWMLELTGGTPINPKKGRLLPSPEKTTSSGLAALELDKSHNGKTVSAVVGQEIVIRLKGNVTTGYSWVVGKIEGDALGQVGKVKYVSDQPPMPAGGRGGGIMIHRVGGGGKYVFTFRATKAGTAKLSLEYKRGWEKNKPPAKTFALTVVITEPPKATAEQEKRIAKLIGELGSKEFKVRQRATEELSRMGPVVIPQVSRATESEDPEVAARAREILKAIEERRRKEALAEAGKGAQGITGKVIKLTGDFMPGPGERRGGRQVLSVPVWVFKGKVKPFKKPDRKHPALVKVVQSGKDGTYRAALPPGEYTIIAEIKGRLYLNLYDGTGHWAAVTVKKGKWAKFDIKDTSEATF